MKSAVEISLFSRMTHCDHAVASLFVMQLAGLHFKSSVDWKHHTYVSNLEVADLEKRVQENIPPHLLYLCQFWVTHLQGA